MLRRLVTRLGKSLIFLMFDAPIVEGQPNTERLNARSPSATEPGVQAAQEIGKDRDRMARLDDDAACTCGDQNSDGNTDLADWAAFSLCFGLDDPTPACPQSAFDCADVIEDGWINLAAFSVFALSFGIPSKCIPLPILEYGVKLEQSTFYAFIRVRDGRELAAVAFDPSTEFEDYATQRFLGYTPEQLEQLAPGTDVEILNDFLFIEATSLWQGTFPRFDGTPGTLAILNRQSQLLAILRSLAGAERLGLARGVNGCTAVSDFDFEGCCNQHDVCYEGCGAIRGCGSGSRSDCDECLRQCIVDCSRHPGLARIYWAGVRVFGVFFYDAACDDDDPCTDDCCNPLIGCVHESVQEWCDNFSTACETYTCVDGSCRRNSINCDDDDPCTKDSCNAITGCVHESLQARCDAFNTGCVTNACVNGSCDPDGVDCDDDDSCTDDSCNAITGCIHESIQERCNAFNTACTTYTCVNGVCRPTSMNCDDHNPATRNLCSGQTGCHNPLNSAPCSVWCPLRSDACTTYACEGSQCRGTSIDCDDDDACTRDYCNAQTGCYHESIYEECAARSDACVTYRCVDGSCRGILVNCDDGDPCTKDNCNARTGCYYESIQEICAARSDACLTYTCINGECRGSLENCNDHDTCTSESCNARLGCQHNPICSAACCDDDDQDTLDFCNSCGHCIHLPNTCNGNPP